MTNWLDRQMIKLSKFLEKWVIFCQDEERMKEIKKEREKR